MGLFLLKLGSFGVYEAIFGGKYLSKAIGGRYTKPRGCGRVLRGIDSLDSN